MSLIQFQKSYANKPANSRKPLTLQNLRLNNGYPINPKQISKVTTKLNQSLSEYLDIISTALDFILEDIDDTPMPPKSKIMNFNAGLFQSYGLNPLKNILKYPEINECLDMIDENTFAAHKPMDSLETSENEFYQTITEILSCYDILENFVIFVAFANNTYGIFKLNYVNIEDFFENDDEEFETDIELDIQIIKGNSDIFAMYDSMYSPAGYGLITEINADTWRIIR